MKAVVIIGPTAVGKTDMSINLAGEDFEIVSADSVQVYRHLDIGSGKPDGEIRAVVRHHLIDIVDPDYSFSAGDYCRYAEKACSEIIDRSKLPLFVGGTGLYVDSFFYGLASIPGVDKSIRHELYREIDAKGLDCMHAELMNIDPAFARAVHPRDRQRIVRGLEVFRGTGQSISSFYADRTGRVTDKTLFIGLCDDRDRVRERIRARVESMLAAGLVDEVKNLRSMGYGPGLKSMRSIGYAEINRYLDGLNTLEEAVETIKVNTARYAKRQMTWFRRHANIMWFGPDEVKKITELVKEWIDN